jgi:hypothetical protein
MSSGGIGLKGIRIGEILVEQGVLTRRQVEHILKVQKISNRPFGDLAERLFDVSAEAVEDAWVRQYVQIAGVSDLDELSIDEHCLRMLNRRQAWQFHLLPIARRRNELQLATTADQLVRAVNFSTRHFNEPVYLRLAEREQLRRFLMKHYPVPSHIAEYAESLT